MAPARIIVKTINVHYKGVRYKYKNSPSVVNARNTILQSSTAVATIVLLLWRNAIDATNRRSDFSHKIESIHVADSLLIFCFSLVYALLKISLSESVMIAKGQNTFGARLW